MISTTSETAAAVAAATTTGGNGIEADSDLFTKELQSRLATGAQNTVKSAQDKIADTMERLSAAFPGTTVNTKAFSGSGEVASYYTKNSLNYNVSISSEMMEAMADDEELLGKIEGILSTLFSAGEQQGLTSHQGAAGTTRNVIIDDLQIRYVEVQRTSSGSTMSMAQLALSTDQMIANALDVMLGRKTSTSSTSGNDITSTLLGNSTNRANSFQSSQNSWDFLSSSASWEMELWVSNSTSANQMLQRSQSFVASIDIVIEQWVDGGAKVDLFTYMQMMGLCDPIVLDLGDEGINLSSAEDGVYFDIKGDGSPVKTAFVTGNNAFLYMDQNGNGVADDVTELFGDHGGYANGFENLRQYDDNGDGVIDENDAVYSQLRLWRDLNGDGVNQLEESLSMKDAGVASINLNYDKTYNLDQGGNVIGEKSSFTRTDGSKGLAADVWLRNI